MRAVQLAWLAGLGIIAYRSARVYRMPPVPGQLLGASGLFALLALAAEYQPAARVAGLTAWGFVLAAALVPGVLPGTLGGSTPANNVTATGPNNAGSAPTPTGA